ncbi:MAG: acyl--CoA ligase [Spirochaetes bacterium]|nr:acyl--CoA ligase [Spirochaetota bacterium]
MPDNPIRLLHETLLCSSDVTPSKIALVTEGSEYTYSQILDKSFIIASILKEYGAQRGDRIALYIDNSDYSVMAIYGILLIGCVFVVINPQTKSDKLAYILNNSDAKILITDSNLSSFFFPVLNQFLKIKALLFTGKEEVVFNSLEKKYNYQIEFLPKLIYNTSPFKTISKCISLDLASLIYTSGSTGDPKGVMHTHQSMLFAAYSIVQYLRLSQEDRILNVLPLAFDYGLYQLLMSVLIGATLILERSFTFPGLIINRMLEQKVNVFPGVPTIYSYLISSHRRKPLCFPDVTRVTNTAAALPEDYNIDLHEIFPNALIYRMYGLTECKRVCYLEPELNDIKPSSVGKAIPGTEVFLLSPEGEPVPYGENGILHVRGTHVMLGYWKDHELSSKMLKPGDLPCENILCTQDWFSMDEEGFLYFKGRSDDIIKTRGEKVSPIEVENALLSIKGIREAAVIAIPDELLGNAIKAFVSVDDSSLTPKLIQNYCMQKLENFMVPKIIEVVESLPKTETGKITKKGLK